MEKKTYKVTVVRQVESSVNVVAESELDAQIKALQYLSVHPELKGKTSKTEITTIHS